MERIALFESLLKDEFKTPEDIYNIMLEWYPDSFKTQKIMRRHKKWSDCIYKGAIGENDFIVSEAHASSVEPDTNIQMVVDDYKDTMIRFIELYREYHKDNKDKKLLSSLIDFIPKFLTKEFSGSTRHGSNAREQRKEVSYLDEKSQMKTYKMSDQKGDGRVSVCCERNTVVGNILQFVGYETLQVSGTLTEPKDYAIDSEGHQFILIKLHNGKYSLLDFFNGIARKDVLPGDYDFSKGFSITVPSNNPDIDFIYEVDGTLFEMTEDILNVEAIFRGLNRRHDILDHKNRSNQAIDLEGELIPLRQEYLDLQELISNSTIQEEIKNRLISLVNDYVYILNKIEKGLTNNKPQQLK